MLTQSKTNAILLFSKVVFTSTIFGIVDFETSGPLFDNAEILLEEIFVDSESGASFQFGIDTTGPFDGISRDQSVFLEASGDFEMLRGFFYTQGMQADTESPFNISSGLGDFFIRPGTLMGNPFAEGAVFVIELPDLALEVSGQIWDIDGGVSGEEQYRVTAWGSDGIELVNIESPIGMTSDASSLDGLPWDFSIAAPGVDFIEFVTIDFIGTKPFNIGVGFDNFGVVAVPEVSVYSFVIGVLALTVTVRRRNKCHLGFIDVRTLL